MGDMGLPSAIIGRRDGVAINLQGTIGRLEQAHDNIQQSAFTATARAMEKYAFTSGNLEFGNVDAAH